MGKSSAARSGRQAPVVQQIADERRELYIKPRSLIPAWRSERGVDPRPDIDRSYTVLSSPIINTSTKFSQPDLHTDARDPAYAPPQGGPPKKRVKFSKLVQAKYDEQQEVPDAPQMAHVNRLGNERSTPAIGSISSTQAVHQMYQRRVSAWRRTRWQPASHRLKGL